MAPAVKRPYDNSRRQAQVRATRLRIIEAAKALFIAHGYPATTLEAIADAADTSLPTLYRLFSSKPALLKAVLDVSFGGDDQPVAFGDRPDVQAARGEPDPHALITAFARIGRDFMERSSAIMRVLATAAQVDPDAAQLMDQIRHQRHTGQSRITAALSACGALDPDLELSEAADITYAVMSPDVHHILTVERGWTAGQYEQWLLRSLGALLRSDPGTTTSTQRNEQPRRPTRG
jgi:TetR/AcrR family transcriptional regulator, regulator of autoinduction and epiphytic fitness